MIMIREATLKDSLAIAEVHIASWKSSYIGQVPQEYLDSLLVETRAKAWQNELNELNHKTLVAEVSGKIVGFSNFGISRDDDSDSVTGELYAIYITEANKRKGIGSQLWLKTLEYFIQMNFQKVTLWVLDSNLNARRYYERIGFELDSLEKRDKIGEKDVVELRYTRKLS